MNRFLITGNKSGLGRYLYEHFGGVGLGRSGSTEKLSNIRQQEFDVIIHAAAQSPKSIKLNSLYQLVEDNVLLTKRVAKFNHKKFVFISSVDVYPKDKRLHTEKEDIDLSSASNVYGITKLMSESIVMKMCPNYLILRCTALLGEFSRKNSLIKIAEDESPELTLRSDSVMNYILHSQVAEFIKYAIENNITGIYNIASSTNIKFGNVAKIFNKKPKFGAYRYMVGSISNKKICSIFPSFKKTSEEIVHHFMKSDFPKRKKT